MSVCEALGSRVDQRLLRWRGPEIAPLGSSEADHIHYGDLSSALGSVATGGDDRAPYEGANILAPTDADIVSGAADDMARARSARAKRCHR